MQVWFSNRRAKWRREEKLRHNRHTRSSSSASSNVEPNMSQSAAAPQSQQPGHHQSNQPPTSHQSQTSGLGSPDILGVTSLSDLNSSANASSPSPATTAAAAAAAAAAAVASTTSRIPLSSGFANHSLYHTIPQPIPSMADTYR